MKTHKNKLNRYSCKLFAAAFVGMACNMSFGADISGYDVSGAADIVPDGHYQPTPGHNMDAVFGIRDTYGITGGIGENVSVHAESTSGAAHGIYVAAGKTIGDISASSITTIINTANPYGDSAKAYGLNLAGNNYAGNVSSAISVTNKSLEKYALAYGIYLEGHQGAIRDVSGSVVAETFGKNGGTVAYGIMLNYDFNDYYNDPKLSVGNIYADVAAKAMGNKANATAVYAEASRVGNIYGKIEAFANNGATGIYSFDDAGSVGDIKSTAQVNVVSETGTATGIVAANLGIISGRITVEGVHSIAVQRGVTLEEDFQVRLADSAFVSAKATSSRGQAIASSSRLTISGDENTQTIKGDVYAVSAEDYESHIVFKSGNFIIDNFENESKLHFYGLNGNNTVVVESDATLFLAKDTIFAGNVSIDGKIVITANSLADITAIIIQNHVSGSESYASNTVFGENSVLKIILDEDFLAEDGSIMEVILNDGGGQISDSFAGIELEWANGSAYDELPVSFIEYNGNLGILFGAQVPEPSTCASVIGALALGFAAYRRRITYLNE